MNICQPGWRPATFYTGGEKWTREDIPSTLDETTSDDAPILTEESIFFILSPQFFSDDGEFKYFANITEDVPPSDCKFTITPKNSDEKIIIQNGFFGVDMESGKNFTDLTTDMDCGDDYFSINGVKKCGVIDFINGNSEDFWNVELVEAGESVEFHLKNTNPEVYVMLAIYTGTEPLQIGPGSRSFNSENTYKNAMEFF